MVVLTCCRPPIPTHVISLFQKAGGGGQVDPWVRCCPQVSIKPVGVPAPINLRQAHIKTAVAVFQKALAEGDLAAADEHAGKIRASLLEVETQLKALGIAMSAEQPERK